MNTNKEPTEEQIKELWEWCGFTYSYLPPHFVTPNGESLDSEPDIDLNNLFKWAVSKLIERGIHSIEFLYDEDGVRCFLAPLSNWTRDQDPALALFWAIYKVIKNDN